jgi:hypothetical protein
LPQLLQYDRLAIKLAQIKNRKRCDKNKEATVKESDKYMWAGGAMSIVGVVFVVPENIIIGIITVGVGLFLLTTGIKKR